MALIINKRSSAARWQHNRRAGEIFAGIASATHRQRKQQHQRGGINSAASRGNLVA